MEAGGEGEEGAPLSPLTTLRSLPGGLASTRIPLAAMLLTPSSFESASSLTSGVSSYPGMLLWKVRTSSALLTLNALSHPDDLPVGFLLTVLISSLFIAGLLCSLSAISYMTILTQSREDITCRFYCSGKELLTYVGNSVIFAYGVVIDICQ